MMAFLAPVRRARGGFVVRLGADEAELVRRLLAELGELLRSDDPAATAITARLFPVAHPDDDEMEAEYQRLMRDELVSSRLEAIATVDEILGTDDVIDEPRLTAFMQSINAVRLVLGTMLSVSDDPDADEVAAGVRDSPEHHLYGYLSWLLEHTVQALSGR